MTGVVGNSHPNKRNAEDPSPTICYHISQLFSPSPTRVVSNRRWLTISLDLRRVVFVANLYQGKEENGKYAYPFVTLTPLHQVLTAFPFLPKRQQS
jgi:hypothetical protein